MEKIPYNIHRKDGALFAFAGIFDVWKTPDGEGIKTFAIVTTAPNILLAQSVQLSGCRSTRRTHGRGWSESRTNNNQ